MWLLAAGAATVAGSGAYTFGTLGPERPSASGEYIQVVHVSPDGCSVQALVEHGACERGRRRIEVNESPAEVRLRVLGARPTGGTCIAVLIRSRLTARLATPLGTRRILDWTGERPLQAVSP